MIIPRKHLLVFIVLAIIFTIIILLISINKPVKKLLLTKMTEPTLKESDIKFDEYVYDFGLAKVGEKVDHTFKFRNDGNEEFIIDKASGSCGCTAIAKLTEKHIPPNGEGEIKVSFNTAGYAGFVSQKIYVHSNVPAIQLKIQGIVKTGLSVYPENINFGSIGQENQESRRINIAKIGDENLEITEVTSSSDYISTQITEIPQYTPEKTLDEYNKRFEVQVVIAPDIPIERFNETITIYTNDETLSEIKVPVVGKVINSTEIGVSEFNMPILVFPPLFLFDSLKQGEIASRQISIKTTSDNPWKIEKIENPLEEFLSIAITTKVEGKEYEIIASLKENAPAGNIKDSIVIHTNSLDQPYIEIPINVSIKE
ncbi:MAG: DUF1573 domain-containing protein [Candidatus Omnitrophica bacterium]|nr:DUF1573 domain-containing protein [Candidatus Omnitrophota bacterium]MBU1047505.1 DUF1573 domain-containing protein [Candidatus Omnitrophota bacterium]MBU1631036.1 DUF1573 domain-containing protein [Candidatus Omnitrophota bacterium]MBU1766683.1 DUF1573 domain-containing protein [Candidatus Omnitrophota bacterium]MBU1888868.1 DUF1573 domain-containing protein [Candidatus Omnitrophota bacterium]